MYNIVRTCRVSFKIYVMDIKFILSSEKINSGQNVDIFVRKRNV